MLSIMCVTSWNPNDLDTEPLGALELVAGTVRKPPVEVLLPVKPMYDSIED